MEVGIETASDAALADTVDPDPLERLATRIFKGEDLTGYQDAAQRQAARPLTVPDSPSGMALGRSVNVNAPALLVEPGSTTTYGGAASKPLPVKAAKPSKATERCVLDPSGPSPI